jgi:hypothetical protein
MGGIRMTPADIAARCGGLTIGGVKVGMRELIECGHVRARWDGEDAGWTIRLLNADAQAELARRPNDAV